jgi:Copine
MSGPTDISEVIQTAAARAKNQQQVAKAARKQAYGILLIITDGAVSDIHQTAQSMNQCSDAPLSIVIVGVGNADFSSMMFLDDHSQPPGTPDIAQFVKFNDHCQSSADLTSETLHEIPTQLVNYFQRNGIQPLPPIVRSDDDIVVDVEDEEIDLSLSFRDDGDIVVASGGVKAPDDFVSGFRA